MKYALNFETEALGDTAEFDEFAEDSTNSFWELDEYSDHECESCSEFDPEYDESEWEAEIMRGRRVPQRPVRLSPRSQRSRLRPRVIRRPGLVIADTSICTCPAPNCPRHDSEYVRGLQSGLNQIMNLRLSVTGIMGSETRSAIRSFQKRQGLPITGLVGPDTERALMAATASVPKSELEELKSFDTEWANLEQEAQESDPELGEDEKTTHFSTELEGGIVDLHCRTTGKSFPYANPNDLVSMKGYDGRIVKLHNLAFFALQNLIITARANGIPAPLLLPVSGYRSLSKQKETWENALRKYNYDERVARKWVCKPSPNCPHLSGLAVDLWLGSGISSSNVSKQRKTPAYQWMVANAHRFGFTSYCPEPWHWEYNLPASGQSELFSGNYDFLEFEDEFEDEGRDSNYGETPQQIASSGIIAAPKLLGQEHIPAGHTLYVNIPLGSEQPAKPMTGIFIPRHFRSQPQVDLIIYLHGIKPKADLTIDRYWNTRYFPYWPFREGVSQSGKNLILIAPTLGPRSQHQTGWLTKPGGFDKYIDLVLAALAAYGPYRNTGQQPRVGNIILACHSGGGLPMRKLALEKNSYASLVKECWGFDCLYFSGDETLWAQWAKSHPDAKLYIYYLNSTSKRSLSLKQKRLPNIFVASSTAKGHNWVPVKHWTERLQSTGFLLPAPGRGTVPASTPMSKEFTSFGSRWSPQFETAIEDWEGNEFEEDEYEDAHLLPELEQEWSESSALPLLYPFSPSSTKPTIGNVLAIMKSICLFHSIPWRIGYTILEHEGGISKFTHPDGVMQTTQAARNGIIPRIPRLLKLALLGLPQNDQTADASLNQSLHMEFPHRLLVQIAAGVQELQDNLQKFNGYVALAFQAYNAGTGWTYYTVTQGKNKSRPQGIASDYWETLCRFGASLLHQLPGEVKIDTAVWQCDKNIPTWFSHVPVHDQYSRLPLIAYKYLRRIPVQIRENRPGIPCNPQNHKKRELGTGQIITKMTRDGALDKLYNPKKLGRSYYNPVKSQLTAIAENNLPLRVLNGQLVKMPLMSGPDVSPIPISES